MIVTIKRIESDDQGTFGELTVDGFVCHTGELPWRENQHEISCIPEGTYPCVWAFSPHLQKECYHVLDVPDREDILIHAANFMGDTEKGFKAAVQGCIALGLLVGNIGTQKVLLRSRKAVQEFEDAMQKEPFTLVVEDE